MSDQEYVTVITNEKQQKGMSGWLIALIVTLVVIFCCCCISIFLILIGAANLVYGIFNQIGFLYA